MPLLISLCNQIDTPNSSLLLMDEITQGAHWIRLPEICLRHVGCTGIERVNGLTYVLTQAVVNPHLVVYDIFFQVLHTIELRQIRDPHSLCFLEGFLYLVSTGNNSIYRVKLSSSGIPEGEAELYWRYPGGTEARDLSFTSIPYVSSTVNSLLPALDPKRSRQLGKLPRTASVSIFPKAELWPTDCTIPIR